MSTNNHTPGPWHACCADSKAHFVFGPAGDETICEMAHNDPAESGFEPACGVVTMEERRANARLIAASPSLYDFVSCRAEQGDAEALNLLIALNIYSHAEDD